MKITETQLYSAIREYIDRYVMPLGASMDWKEQAKHHFKVGIVKYRVERLVKTYLNNNGLKMLEIVDSEGNIDVEPIYQSARDVFTTIPTITAMGIDFKSNDLETLYSIMQKQAGGV